MLRPFVIYFKNSNKKIPSERFFNSVMKVPHGTLRIKRSMQCLEFKLLLITAKNNSVIMYA